METESTAITAPSTLLEELVERTRLSPLQLTVVVELVLITILVGTAYLDGVLAHPFDNARTADGARQSNETVPGVERADGAGRDRGHARVARFDKSLDGSRGMGQKTARVAIHRRHQAQSGVVIIPACRGRNHPGGAVRVPQEVGAAPMIIHGHYPFSKMGGGATPYSLPIAQIWW